MGGFYNGREKWGWFTTKENGRGLQRTKKMGVFYNGRKMGAVYNGWKMVVVYNGLNIGVNFNGWNMGMGVDVPRI
jgi:hypothetical protein